MPEIVPIVAGLVINEIKDRILLIRRADSMWGDAWSIPGGHIDYGESCEEALVRELKEELNLKIISYKFDHQETFKHPKKEIQFISLNFLVVAGADFTPNEEIKEAKWFLIDELENIKHKIPKSFKISFS